MLTSQNIERDEWLCQKHASKLHLPLVNSSFRRFFSSPFLHVEEFEKVSK